MTAYIIKTDNFTAEQIDSMAAVLPAERQACTARFFKEINRIESTAAAYLTFFALEKCLINSDLIFPSSNQLLEKLKAIEKLACKIGWQIGENGKPFQDGININGHNYHVSISHSNGLVSAAVADKPVGIDIQYITDIPPKNMLQIASRFHPNEYKFLRSTPHEKLSNEFFRLWTYKESVLKLCGSGLKKSLSSFCLDDNGLCVLDGRTIRLKIYNLAYAIFSLAQWE